MKTAAVADLYPVAIGTDAIVYPPPGPSPLDVLPHTLEGKPEPGTFRLGVSPGSQAPGHPDRPVGRAAVRGGGVLNIANLIKIDQSAGEGE
ncbi:hypothetical protein [Streptomyces sp. NPDC018584]|uniref:hypothetical protein n=1 Tax=unclassified Streptomyces TaxID=2593676 RepID=UPI003797378F